MSYKHIAHHAKASGPKRAERFANGGMVKAKAEAGQGSTEQAAAVTPAEKESLRRSTSK